MSKKFIFMVLILVLIGAGFAFNRSGNTSLPTPLTSVANHILPTPTPIPFVDLTIPYLRTRAYTSTLGPLEKLSENTSFTTYKTNYDSDGLNIYGLLTIPKRDATQSSWPAIIFVHGYIPPTVYRTTQNYIDYVNYFARNGFVVFKIDLRGHDKSEGEPGGAYYSSDYVIDTLNAYSALQSSDFVNPNAIGLWGHSMAGNVVSRAFVAKPTIPAVVIWAGAGYTYADIQEYGIDDNSYRPPVNDSARQQKRKLLFDTHGQFSEASNFWKQVAITDYLKDLKGAIQINHAKDDPVVSIEYSQNLMRLLDDTSVVHQLYEYPTGGHNLTGNSFTQAMQRNVEFFRKYLVE